MSSDSSTLYIDGLTFSRSTTGVWGIVSDRPLNIIATGTNTITCLNPGIYIYGDNPEALTISSGSSSEATVKVTSSSGYAITSGNCTITSVNLSAMGTGTSGGLYISGELNMNSGNLTATNLYVVTALKMKDGMIYVYNDLVSYNNAETSLISGGSVITQGKASFNGLELQGGILTARDHLEFGDTFTQTKGTVQSYGDVYFEFGNYIGKGGSLMASKGIATQSGDILISGANVRAQSDAVDIKGNLTVSGGTLYSDKHGIRVGRDVHVSGSGIINAAYQETDESADCWPALEVGGAFLADGGTVDVTASNSKASGMRIQGNTTINNGTVTTKIDNQDSQGTAFDCNGYVNLNGGKLVATAGSNSYAAICQGDIQINNNAVLEASSEIRAGLVTFGSFTLNSGSVTLSSTDLFALQAKKVTMKDGTLTLNGNARLWIGLSSLDLANDIWLSEPSDGMIGNAADDFMIREKDGSAASHAVLRKVSSISVKNGPGNDLYEGDCFNPSGLVLNVNFSGGSTAPLSYNDAHKDMFSLSPSLGQKLSTENRTLSISCLGKTTSVGLTVKEVGTPVLSGEITTGGVKLSWTKAYGAQSYRVFAGDTGSGSLRPIAEIDNANTTTTTVSGLNPGESKDYTVYATRVSDTGTQIEKQSNVITLTAPIDAPRLTALAEGYDSASLSWNAVDGATGYSVYRQEGSGSFTEIKTTEDTSLEDTGLKTGTEYTYYVKAKRGSGVSTESNHATVTPTFTGSTTLTVSNNNSGYYLAWDAVNGAASYEIWRGDGENGEQSHIADIDTNAYTDSSADSYSTYNYMVKPNRIVGGNTFYADNSNVAIGQAMEKPHDPEPQPEPEPVVDPDPEPVIVPPVKDDPSGAVFGLLQARAAKVTKTSIRIKWKKVAGARKYVIYGNKCGIHNKYKKMLSTTNLTMTFTKVAGQRVKKGTYYKFLVYAVDGKGKIISTSKTVHVATTGGKVGNDKAVRTAAKKKKVTIKKGKSFRLKAKPVPKSKKLKVQRHRKIAYETSNSKIATVSSKGVIKAKSKGICYVYAYTQNGIFAKVKVTVK